MIPWQDVILLNQKVQNTSLLIIHYAPPINNLWSPLVTLLRLDSFNYHSIMANHLGPLPKSVHVGD